MTTTTPATKKHARNLVVFVSVLAAGPLACDDSGANEGAPGDSADEMPRGTVSTHYLGAGNYSRQICAVGWPTGTYNAQITSKGYWSGECENISGVMYPVPAESITSEFCADLGLDVKAVDGGIEYCATTDSDPVVVDVYCYDFSSWNVELNYEVVDVGDGEVFGSSGWQPSLGNGCPHDGFPW